MAITYGFFNAVKQADGTFDRTYNADQVSNYFEGLVSDGVYESVDNAMQVLAGSGMQVQVSSGRAIINSKWIKNTAIYPLTINAAHVTLNRYTAVVVRLDSSERTITITTKDGENATTPDKPAMTNSETVKEICLAYVYVGRGVTGITQANIEDARSNKNVCGWVTGIIQQVDTSKLFLQYQAAYEQQLQTMEEWQKEQQVAFDKWLSDLTGNLQVDTYVENYNKNYHISETTSDFLIDIENYTYARTDIILVYLNGLKLMEGKDADYILNTSEESVSIKMNNALNSNNELEIIVLKSKIGAK